MWTLDLADPEYNCRSEGHYSSGPVADLEELKTDLSSKIMVGRNNHFYTRDSGWAVHLELAFDIATDELADLLGLPDTDEPNAQSLKGPPMDPSK